MASIATYRYLLPCISMCVCMLCALVGNHSKFDDLAFTDKVVVDDGDPSPSSLILYLKRKKKKKKKCLLRCIGYVVNLRVSDAAALCNPIAFRLPALSLYSYILSRRFT